MQLYLGALLTAVLVAVRGLRSASLSPSGALAASILGYAALASPLKVFSACLLGFYFAGSKATKVCPPLGRRQRESSLIKLTYESCPLLPLSPDDALQVKAAVKATYEEPEAPSTQQKASASSPTTAPPHSTPSSAGRTATQVACNALVGALCAVTWRVFYSGERAGAQDWAKEGAWCVVGLDPRGRTHSRALVLAAVAFWAACCGDTVRHASSLLLVARVGEALLT